MTIASINHQSYVMYVGDAKGAKINEVMLTGAVRTAKLDIEIKKKLEKPVVFKIEIAKALPTDGCKPDVWHAYKYSNMIGDNSDGTFSVFYSDEAAKKHGYVRCMYQLPCLDADFIRVTPMQTDGSTEGIWISLYVRY